MTPKLHRRCGGIAAVGLAAAAVLLLIPVPAAAGQAGGGDDVTFTKHVTPILQRSCQSCHRPNSLAPMSLITYEEVRPWARSIKYRTGLRNRMGVMPPWFLEKDIGIQAIKDDMSLTEEEIATIAAWVDNGAARGNPEDMPPPLAFAAPGEWEMGEPDLVVKGPSASRAADDPDWWGALPPVETGLTEDRFVKTMQVKEVGDSARDDRRPVHLSPCLLLADRRGGQRGRQRRLADDPRSAEQPARLLVRPRGGPVHTGGHAAAVGQRPPPFERRGHHRPPAGRVPVPSPRLPADEEDRADRLRHRRYRHPPERGRPGRTLLPDAAAER